MLISFLAKRNIVLPFTDVKSLMENSDTQIVVRTYLVNKIYCLIVFNYVSMFRLSLDQALWMISDCPQTLSWLRLGKKD